MLLSNQHILPSRRRQCDQWNIFDGEKPLEYKHVRKYNFLSYVCYCLIFTRKRLLKWHSEKFNIYEQVQFSVSNFLDGFHASHSSLNLFFFISRPVTKLLWIIQIFALCSGLDDLYTLPDGKYTLSWLMSLKFVPLRNNFCFKTLPAASWSQIYFCLLLSFFHCWIKYFVFCVGCKYK